MESVTFPHQNSMDVLEFQGWVSCGRFLAVEPLLYTLSCDVSAKPPGTGPGYLRAMCARFPPLPVPS
eukprot:2252995-Pyramimonas_sp.AAC.1